MQKKFEENLFALPTITIAVIGNSILPSFRKPLISTSKPAVWRSLYYYYDYDSYYCGGGYIVDYY